MNECMQALSLVGAQVRDQIAKFNPISKIFYVFIPRLKTKY